MSEALRVLAAPTPAEWVDAACAHWRTLLIDHANCEKKAASSALIEARSCERFELLAPRLGWPLGGFYDSLRRSEARHFELYLRLARRASNDDALCERRLHELAAVEAELITAPDEELRFHSGPAAALPA